MQAKKVTALKRIANDMKELAKSPLEGIGMASIDNDPMKFVVNIELMTGPYEGYKVQLLMTMSDEYPIKPPKMLIFPGQLIGKGGFHHHIFQGSEGYMRFCINLLDNDYLDTNEQHTGWNPAYTISSILLQVQNFIGDPDMHQLPSKSSIQRLMKSMDSYKRTFILRDEEGEKKVVHTWKDPYPKMYSMKNQMEEEENEVKEKKDKLERKQETIKENLTCYLLRDNYIENQEVLLGYPVINSKSAYGKDKIELYPIPQLLTYEAYKMQMSEAQPCQNQLIDSYYNTQHQVKAANNEYYNNWLPIYVDENHYIKNRELILNSLKAIKNESQFRPEQVFDILPIILNKMIIGAFNGKSVISSSFIMCYFQYVLLFKRLCQDCKAEYETYVNRKISLITMNDYEVNKKIVPDIGDFLMLIYLSNKDMSTPEMKKMKKVLIEEFLIRQMYWMFHGPECKEIMKSKVVNSSLTVNDEAYLEKFQKDPNFKMRYLDIFVKELHKQDIYHQMIDIITNDNDYLWNYHKNRNYAKRMAEEGITRSFKKLYNQCSQWSKNRMNELIREKMHFSMFFEEDEKMLKDQLYEGYQVNEILKGGNESTDSSDILGYAYESQKGNQLLLITFSVLKKLEEKGFMEELEKNYGIYLGVDAFLEEIKQKLKEIKSFKSLYEFIGTELGQEKTEMNLIVESYEKAKKKRYIRDPNENQRMNNQYQAYQSTSYRGNRYRGQRNGYGYGSQYRYNQR
ncbi:MAG: hypothetical protein J6Y78_05740, partial [Paludibacteraceae bacterium]|nr:hypothetical protein [Paludibacteraceae bacterium]